MSILDGQGGGGKKPLWAMKKAVPPKRRKKKESLNKMDKTKRSEANPQEMAEARLKQLPPDSLTDSLKAEYLAGLAEGKCLGLREGWDACVVCLDMRLLDGGEKKYPNEVRADAAKRLRRDRDIILSALTPRTKGRKGKV